MKAVNLHFTNLLTILLYKMFQEMSEIERKPHWRNITSLVDIDIQERLVGVYIWHPIQTS